ncbi:MAG: hypothetical protein H0U23_10945 [Blastocatellia bacterium]|nr:hypothetical protein [Blastocatellia bacterium]
MRPYPRALPHLALLFVVVGEGENILYDCALMHPEAAAAHAEMFTSLYQSGEFEEQDTEGSEDQEGRWQEMKIRDTPVVEVDPATSVAPTVAKTVQWKPKRWKKKKKSDPFDPFSGILY